VENGEGVTGAWRVGGGIDFFITDSWKLVADASYTKAMASGSLEDVIMGLGFGVHFY
jgi:hypothetical protein